MQSDPPTTATTQNSLPGSMNTAQSGGMPPGPQMTDDPSDPGSYIRDPHKLVAYIVPFPAPRLSAGHPEPPLRFVIYTPPPPPLLKPAEGQKEHVSHKIQRKWQEEVREAKESNAKVASWKGIKSRVTKGISWAVDRTTSADLDFITRIPDDDKKKDKRHGSEDEHDPAEGDHTGRTVKLEEMVLVYPPSMNMTPDQLKTEFVNSLMRTKSKAERDAVIASGLLPVAAAADWALIFVGWVFGGLLEVDGVWAAASIRGAKTSRSIAKRLASSTKSGDPHSGNESLHLNFVPSPRAEVLQRYLGEKCIERNPQRFGTTAGPAGAVSSPQEAQVLDVIGWTPSDRFEEKNWEDEAWERRKVEEDVKQTMTKAAKAWDHWVKLYEKNPKKAEKK